MARYADGLIADGEHILLRTRQHWFSIVAYTMGVWVVLSVAVVSFVIDRITDFALFGWLSLLALIVAMGWIAWRYIQWSFQDYLVTNRRVMQVEGIINKVSSDSSLEKINDAILRQGLFGRLLHFGDLDILTASDTTVDQFKMLNQAAEFKKTMLNAKYALERDVATPMPSAPLRAPNPSATGDSGTAAGSIGGPGPGPGAVAPAAHSAMSAEEVTDTLHRLADLRDRGAISPAEYDAKKADLLERL